MLHKQWGSVIIMAALAAMLTGCNQENSPPDQSSLPVPAATVSVAQVTKRLAGKQAELVGTVQAVEQAEISAKITGNIVNLPVDLGRRVKQGELLVEISAGEISARVQQAKAQLDQTRRNLAREESLLQKSAATPQSVKTLRDSARIAEAAFNEAATMLTYTRIVAPFSGIVTRKIGNVGDLATPGKALLHLEQENNLQLLADIPEAMILRIHKGDRLPVFVPSIPLATTGEVAEVSPVADPSSRSAPIKLALAPDPRLRSGQFARVSLAVDLAETLTVPVSAVVLFGQIERVFVMDDNRAWLRLVRSGTEVDGYLEILRGLQEGETVITEGHHNLLDGQPVEIK